MTAITVPPSVHLLPPTLAPRAVPAAADNADEEEEEFFGKTKKRPMGLANAPAPKASRAP